MKIRNLKWAVSLFFLLVIVVLIFGAQFFSDLCLNKKVYESISPGNKYKAIAFHRDCGADTKSNTQVSILGFNEKLAENSSGNVFSSDRNLKEQSIEIIWIDDENLQIKSKFGERVYIAETRWGAEEDVKIEYVGDGS